MSSYNLWFGPKIRKIGIHLHTPVLLYKSGFMGIYITWTYFRCVDIKTCRKNCFAHISFFQFVQQLYPDIGSRNKATDHAIYRTEHVRTHGYGIYICPEPARGQHRWQYNIEGNGMLCYRCPGPEVIKLFTCSDQLRLKFILLINVKMPTIIIGGSNVYPHSIF